MTTSELKYDLMLFTNDLAEHQNTEEGKAVFKAFYDSTWGDYDLPENMYMADLLGEIYADEKLKIEEALAAYWEKRNG